MEKSLSEATTDIAPIIIVVAAIRQLAYCSNRTPVTIKVIPAIIRITDFVFTSNCLKFINITVVNIYFTPWLLLL